MKAPSVLRRKPLTAGISLALVGLVGSSACGVDDRRVMRLAVSAGTAGSSLTAGSPGSGGTDSAADGQGASSGHGGHAAGSGGMAGEGGVSASMGGAGAAAGGAGAGGKAGSASNAAGSTSAAGKAGSGPTDPCGNNHTDAGEQCDDGNRESGDGCSFQCKSSCEDCEADAVSSELGSLLDADWYTACYQATDRANGGPANGAPRSALCAAVVDCVRRTNCASFSGAWLEGFAGQNDASLTPCWCTDLVRSSDEDHLPQPAPSCYNEATLKAGPCYADFLNAAESDDPIGIGTAAIDSSRALGRAGSLLRQTDSLFCAKACWPDPSMPTTGGSGGAAGAGGASGAGGAGGTGGSGGNIGLAGSGGVAGSNHGGTASGGTAATAGSGGGGAAGAAGTASSGASGTSGAGGNAGAAGNAGTGGGGSSLCGNGSIDAGEECEPPSSLTCSDDCKRVVDDMCVDSPCEADSACVDLYGCQAHSGSDRTLCYDVMECVRSSNCADGPIGSAGLTKCFCGNLSTSNCLSAPNSGSGSPQGACAGIIRQGFAAGSSMPSNSFVLTNYIDPTYPAGAALERLNCQWSILSQECRTWCGF